MFTNNPWLLSAATGRTGTLIAEEAVARGHRPVLAGRDPDRLRSLAERLDLNRVAGSATEMAQLIGNAHLVLLAAGPFGSTAPAVLRACLDAGVHYLDIANDIPVVAATLAARDDAPPGGRPPPPPPTPSGPPPPRWPPATRPAGAASPRCRRSASGRWPATGWPGTWPT